MTLDDFYAQMLGVMPPQEMGMAQGPVMPASPYATPMQSEAMGMPFPMSLMSEAPPESAQPDPMLGVTSDFGSSASAPAQYGYSPQPRPALPTAISEDETGAGLYGPFRGIWDEMQAEEDPLAGMMARPQEPTPGMGDTRTPQLPWQESQGFGQAPPHLRGGAFGQPRQAGPGGPGGQRYGRAMERVGWLDSLRARRGY
ncbi:MAG: hypothetical protein H0W36_07645 [Gemmatimonadetes bacterium]|nr:hypothetical protein [Gemmatimonadota bacterium]